MAFPNYPPDPIVFQTFSANTVTAIINNVKALLQLAGWSATSIAAYNTWTFTSTGPAHNENVVVGSITYTWKTALTGAAFEVLRDGVAVNAAANLVAAITAGVGEGTTYGTGTTQNTDFTASRVGAVVTITALVSGAAGNGISQLNVGGSSNITTLYNGVSRYGGEALVSVKTTQGFRCLVDIIGDPSNALFYFGSTDRTAYSTSPSALDYATNRQLQIRATAHDFWICMLGDYNTVRTQMGGGLLYVKDSSAAYIITSVSNLAGEYLIETNVAHGYTTADNVFISESEGQLGINGYHPITVQSATTFTLDGTSFSSGYTPNTALVAGTGQISRLIWNWGNAYNAGSVPQLWRHNLGCSGGQIFVCVNQFVWDSLSGPVGGMQGVGKATLWNISPFAGPAFLQRFGSRDFINEPTVAWPVSSSVSTVYELGMFFGAFFITPNKADMDIVKNDFDGYNWIAFTDRVGTLTHGALWLATGRST